MKNLLKWVQQSRPDVLWIRSANDGSTHNWDNSLPNQQEISNLVASFDPNWEPVIVPQSVTPRQMRLALAMSGFSEANILTIINQMPEPDKTYIAITWEYTTEFLRTDGMLNSMAPYLNLDQAALDQLFILAGSL